MGTEVVSRLYPAMYGTIPGGAGGNSANGASGWVGAVVTVLFFQALRRRVFGRRQVGEWPPRPPGVRAVAGAIPACLAAL
ncbi:hypothetical protein Shyhy01_73980 [Streptomyces hygroscopicus subsp. hygroscopicus]|nr:hypothetical protein Shyhy01_73980 [Streptomyces hygroscopicus subsp. hygroscopicus]